jgi:hypothetical protein
VASNTIEQAVGVRLTSSTDVYDHVGKRVYFVQAEVNCAHPYITYSVVSDPHMPFALGNQNTGQARVQIDVWSRDRYEALNVGNHVRDSLRFRSTLDGVTVYWSQCTGPVLMREPDQAVFHAVVEAQISYKEP